MEIWAIQTCSYWTWSTRSSCRVS